MQKPKENEKRKPTRTISGVAPVAVMLPPRKCKHGNCSYCPSLNVPQSYTPKSPVVLRASQVNYDAYEQVKGRLKAFDAMNHPTDKIELIIMGGTFLEYPKKFQYGFIKGCYDALNGRNSKTLEVAKKSNEKAKHRCVALCIETRPDVCVMYISRLLEFGCTRIELGVQIISDAIYKKVKRGHKVKDVIEATKALKNAGFKVGYHIMPGLPGSNIKKDLILFKKLFVDERFKPDQLKIYPCQVLKGAELEKNYWEKKYKPYTKEDIEQILPRMLKIVPRYCRVMRIMREIPPEYLVAGTTYIGLRKDIEERLRSHGIKLDEIRFREIGFADKKNYDGKLKLKITKYKSSGGEEYFLEIVNEENILFGLLRLRLFNDKAIIRELHIYGQALRLGKKELIASQHSGLGKWLMKKL
jgi:elongator complex protein 3